MLFSLYCYNTGIKEEGKLTSMRRQQESKQEKIGEDVG
jgi:hypothetical protein